MTRRVRRSTTSGSACVHVLAVPASVRAATRARHRADASDQLAEAERLHDVVVGAELEPDDTVDLVAARGDDDDRHVGSRAQLRGRDRTRRRREAPGRAARHRTRWSSKDPRASPPRSQCATSKPSRSRPRTSGDAIDSSSSTRSTRTSLASAPGRGNLYPKLSSVSTGRWRWLPYGPRCRIPFGAQPSRRPAGGHATGEPFASGPVTISSSGGPRISRNASSSAGSGSAKALVPLPGRVREREVPGVQERAARDPHPVTRAGRRTPRRPPPDGRSPRGAHGSGGCARSRGGSRAAPSPGPPTSPRPRTRCATGAPPPAPPSGSGAAARGRSARRRRPRRADGMPATTAVYLRSTSWRASASTSASYAAEVRATTRRPLVSRSSRCTIPGRAGSPTEAISGKRASSPCTRVPCACPAPGCTTSPAGLFTTTTSSSAWRTSTGTSSATGSSGDERRHSAARRPHHRASGGSCRPLRPPTTDLAGAHQRLDLGAASSPSASPPRDRSALPRAPPERRAARHRGAASGRLWPGSLLVTTEQRAHHEQDRADGDRASRRR